MLPWMELLTAKVPAVHIGCVEIEAAPRDAFKSAGWTCQWDLSLQGEREMPFGRIRFGDRVQGRHKPNTRLDQDELE